MARAGAGLLLVSLASGLTSCELVTGISDKTLATSGPVGVPCARQSPYLFCDDFDTGTTFGATWDWHSSQPGGTFGFDTVNYASAPRGGRFGATATAVTSAQLGKQGVTLPTALRLAFDLRLDVGDATALPEISVAQVLTTTTGLSVNYVVGPGAQASLQVFDVNGGGPVTTVMLPFPALRTWTNLVLTTDWQSIDVAEDGRPIGSTKSPTTGAPGALKLIVGIVYANPSAGATTGTLELDDVVLGGS